MKWITTIEAYDIETGEQIKSNNIKQYTIIKKEKYVTFNEKNTIGYIKYTKLARRRPQQGTIFN